MPLEQTVTTIIEEYWQQIWLGFVTLVVTGFIMIMVKNFISDLVNYYRARMSDVGYGQRIYWRGQIFIVDGIKFKHIVAHDDKKKILIPINTFISGVKEYPHHRYDDFDEHKYHEGQWDGVTERRRNKKEEA